METKQIDQIMACVYMHRALRQNESVGHVWSFPSFRDIQVSAPSRLSHNLSPSYAFPSGAVPVSEDFFFI